MRVVIAEKPSLGRAIAAVMAKRAGVRQESNEGWIGVGNDVVTWLRGHLYEQAMPEDYDTQLAFPGKLDQLPFIPDEWQLKPSSEDGAKKQLKVVNGWIRKADEIVNAGDAGREGQLLVDEVLVKAGKNPFDTNVKRLWAQSMTEGDLGKALDNLFPNAEKKMLSWAADCRQKADWLHGINLTRLYTLLAQQAGVRGHVISVGRVQTPVLAIVVERDRAIENFQPRDYYLPTITFAHQNGTFRGTWQPPENTQGLDDQGRLLDRRKADVVIQRVQGQKGQLAQVDNKEKSEQPPLPYTLSKLQSELSSKMGMTAKQTLDVVQRLYDRHRVTTYPRTDSPYLPRSILQEEAGRILDNLEGTDAFTEAVRNADRSRQSAAWNDEKVTDHYGIIPTTKATPDQLARLDQVERRVFDLIAQRFVAQFYPPARHVAMTARVRVDQDMFLARGRRELDRGWKRVYSGPPSEDENGENDETEQQALPEMAQGDVATAREGEVRAKRTQPPPRFTDGTLLSAMTNIHRFVPNPEVRKRLRENDGLGTEATRHEMIETPIRRGFLKREKKKIVSTTLGRQVKDTVLDEIADPGMTALWEGTLAEIATGDQSPGQFMEVQHKLLRTRVQKALKQGVQIEDPNGPPLEEDGKTCPRCRDGVLKTRRVQQGPGKGTRFLGCTNFNKNDPENSCRYTEWPEGKPSGGKTKNHRNGVRSSSKRSDKPERRTKSRNHATS